MAFDELGQYSRRDTATECGDPWHQRAGAVVEAGQAITDERIHATGQWLVTTCQGACHLEREQWVAVGCPGDLLGVGTGRDRLGELCDGGRSERTEEQFAERVVAAQRLHDGGAGAVLRELGRAGRDHERDAAGKVADREVQQHERGFVEPLHVIDEDS